MNDTICLVLKHLPLLSPNYWANHRTDERITHRSLTHIYLSSMKGSTKPSKVEIRMRFEGNTRRIKWLTYISYPEWLVDYCVLVIPFFMCALHMVTIARLFSKNNKIKINRIQFITPTFPNLFSIHNDQVDWNFECRLRIWWSFTPFTFHTTKFPQWTPRYQNMSNFHIFESCINHSERWASKSKDIVKDSSIWLSTKFQVQPLHGWSEKNRSRSLTAITKWTSYHDTPRWDQSGQLVRL